MRTNLFRGLRMLNHKILLLSCLVMAYSPLRAETVSYSTSSDTGADRLTVAPSTGLVVKSPQMTVKIVNSCFATNLRGVSNPLAPNSVITTNLNMTIGSAPINIKVSYPASVTTAAGWFGDTSLANMNPNDPLLTSPAPYLSAPAFKVTDGNGQPMNNVAAGLYGNTVYLKFDPPASALLQPNSSGSLDLIAKALVNGYSFSQYVTNCATTAINPAWYYQTYGCGQYMGKTGSLSASVKGVAVAADNSNVELQVSFPGQTGFCGGYFSPLMLFFADERPKFSNTSTFMKGNNMHTSWPEAGAPGYFLAIDHKGGKSITSAKQLFGESTSESNGFVALKALDSNKDGVINSKDKNFSKLLLWQDKNGDAVAQKSEVMKLSEKNVTELSLNYVEENRLLSDTAQEYGVAEFSYKKGSEMVKAKLVDVWLKPTPPANVKK